MGEWSDLSSSMQGPVAKLYLEVLALILQFINMLNSLFEVFFFLSIEQKRHT